MNTSRIVIFFMFALSFSILMSCGGDKKTTKKHKPITAKAPVKIDPMKDTGIGPVKELTLSGEINQVMVDAGKKIYKEKCTACHKVSKKFIGPSPKGIFERRNPAWVMNMILNPDEMVKKNALAKALLMEFNGSPMANQNLTEKEARDIVEYFRTL